MDRLASLIRTARELQRQLWCSLPLGFRIAHFLCALDSRALEGYGRTFYAEFLRNGVKGMPDIFGKPAEQWFSELPDQDKKSRRLADKLPKNYGYGLAESAKKLFLSRFRDLNLVEEGMANVMARFLEHGIELRAGTTLREAEGYVFRAVRNEILNMLDKASARYEKSMFVEEEGETVAIDIKDPNAFENLEGLFPMWKSPVVRRALMGIAAWVPAYLELQVEGYDDGEIFGWPSSGTESFSGSKPSILARKMGLPFVPRPGDKDEPLGRGLWSKPGTGTKARIKKVLEAYEA